MTLVIERRCLESSKSRGYYSLYYLSLIMSEIVCLRNRNIFNAIGIESVIVSNFSQSRTHCTICFILCSRKSESVL